MTARQAGEGAAKVIRKPLSEEELARIDRALTAVIGDAPMFSSFQVDFALSNADRMETYGKWAFCSAKQWKVIEEIEKRMEELT